MVSERGPGRPPTGAVELKVRLPAAMAERIRASAGGDYGALSRRVEALLAAGLALEDRYAAETSAMCRAVAFAGLPSE